MAEKTAAQIHHTLLRNQKIDFNNCYAGNVNALYTRVRCMKSGSLCLYQVSYAGCLILRMERLDVLNWHALFLSLLQ